MQVHLGSSVLLGINILHIFCVIGRRIQKNEIFVCHVKELGFYSQCNKGFIVRISTGKMIWLDLHFRKKTGRDSLIVCQIWWSCQILPVSVPINEWSFLHCILWTYCEHMWNFYYIKPLKFRNSSVSVASTTFIK